MSEPFTTPFTIDPAVMPRIRQFAPYGRLLRLDTGMGWYNPYAPSPVWRHPHQNTCPRGCALPGDRLPSCREVRWCDQVAHERRCLDCGARWQSPCYRFRGPRFHPGVEPAFGPALARELGGEMERPAGGAALPARSASGMESETALEIAAGTDGGVAAAPEPPRVAARLPFALQPGESVFDQVAGRVRGLLGRGE